MTAESFYFYLSAKYNDKYQNYGKQAVCSSYGTGCWGGGGGAKAKERTSKKKVIKKEKKEMTNKFEESERQRQEIKNLKKEKR